MGESAGGNGDQLLPRSSTRVPARTPGIRDVADAAGVSAGTVSNFFNHPELLAEPTRRDVERAVHRLGYQPNQAARELRVGRAAVLGFVALDLENPFYTELAAAIEQVALDAGYSLLVANAANDADRERRVVEALADRRPTGMLVATPITTSWLGGLADRALCCVLVDASSAVEGVTSIAVDDRRGGELAGRHLLDLGHRSFGLINGPERLVPFGERRDGLAESVRDAGLDPDRCVTEVTAEPTPSGGRDGMERLLTRPDRPTAVVCTNDLMAAGALQVLHQHDLDVPGDVSVVGYDDVAVAQLVSPPLTTVRQPIAKMGKLAAELAIRTAQSVEALGDPSTERIVLTPELVVRESTGPA